MAKAKTAYICAECGYNSPRWLGRCPSCGQFNTLEEKDISSAPYAARSKSELLERAYKTLDEIENFSDKRLKTRIPELDRVLSGGVVEGSLVLVGGDPGIGKSTLLLQVCAGICAQDKTALYVSGEESLQQVKMRARRLDITSKNLYMLAETDISAIENAITNLKPDIVIIDSIQTMRSDALTGVPGSVSQVRECTAVLTRIAKSMNISIIIVGHVTKDGALAGPRVLEHMVDAVLYFEGEKRDMYRMIRAVKNRFGATDEIGVFEMRAEGLVDISNPSEYMLNGRPVGVPGSVVTCCVEGTRPIMVEVQALVSHTSFGTPRRAVTGTDFNRTVMTIAVLEKRVGFNLSAYDSYINVAGGLKIAEPALDAAVALAVASSFQNIPADPLVIVFGEIGLTGELRAVTATEKRVAEAAKLGFTVCILPASNMKGLKKPENIRVLGAANVGELLRAGLSK
jgi:DNA repair protein RadA/Sms